MTPHVQEFIKRHRDKLQGRVLEIGSLNVNGSVRSLIGVAVGVDIRPGPGVDLVADVKDLPEHFPAGSFDACVSTETLEHVEDWRKFIKVTWNLVRNDGFLVMTMASQYKGRHAYPDDYWRMTEDMIRRIYPGLEWFGHIPDKPKPTSIGWVVQKTGELGDLDFEPIGIDAVKAVRFDENPSPCRSDD